MNPAQPPLRKRLGFLVGNLLPGQLAYYLLTRAHQQVRAEHTVDLAFFQEEDVLPVCEIACGRFTLAEAWGFTGPLVATSLSTAAHLIEFPSCPCKFFFVHDLEWVLRPGLPYPELARIYRHPDLRLLVRGREPQRLVQACWNVQAEVVSERELIAWMLQRI